jgi:hypothetical protein
MTIGTGIFLSTLLVIAAVAVRMISLHRKWKLVGRVAAVLLAVCIVLGGIVYLWQYIRSLPPAPSEATELAKVRLGMTPTDVTLMLGEPDEKTEPTIQNGEVRFQFNYTSPEVHVTFYGTDKYHAMVSIVCASDPSTKLLGFDSSSTEDLIIRRLGKPSTVSIARNGLSKIDSYSKWKAAFVLSKATVVQMCATSSGRVVFGEELLSPEAQKAADQKAAAEAELQARLNSAAEAEARKTATTIPLGPRMPRRVFDPNTAKSLTPDGSSTDPCSPGLTKAERLRRLSNYGMIRQTGGETYEAGSHSVFYAAGTLISCN